MSRIRVQDTEQGHILERFLALPTYPDLFNLGSRNSKQGMTLHLTRLCAILSLKSKTDAFIVSVVRPYPHVTVHIMIVCA